MKKSYFIFAIACVMSLFGCSFLQPTPQVNRLRQEDPNAIISLKSLKRQTLASLLARPDLNQRVRLVDVFSSETAERPEYRLFDILPGSIYEALGLSDGDVLYSCEGRYLVNGELFKQYVTLLPQLKQASLEFRRGTKVYSMRYTIE